MTKIPSTSHGLTQPTTRNINLLHVCAGAPQEKLRYPGSGASDRVGKMIDPGTQGDGVLTILALDLGTITGWALRDSEGQISHGYTSFRPQRFEGGGMRYLRFKRWMTEIKGIAGYIHALYFEEVRRHAGVDAAHIYGGLMATLTAWCEHYDIPYQGVPVGAIKRHATGRGNAGKDEVISAMQAKGHPVTDDNEADALALLHWAIDTQEV